MNVQAPPGRMAALRRAWRYVTIYGPGRTWFKIAARLRLPRASLARERIERDVGFIGCGQYAYATIGYFLQQRFGARVLACYDTDARAAATLAAGLRVPHVCDNPDSLWATPGLRTVYIASNHASHVPYAQQALARGLDVYVEKPIAVSREQLRALVDAVAAGRGRVFAGYNRPFAGATRALRALMPIDPASGLTMQCFVSGHRLGPKHWYRKPEEGTRVCGNLGHWIDLFVHALGWRGLPDRLDIALTCADDTEADDNMTLAIRSDRADLFVVTLGSRCEPYEGIHETINLQHGETIACIDDFRSLTVWQGPRRLQRRFWPKDVGHRLAVLQPWGEAERAWSEVMLSTLLMLQVADMVRDGRRSAPFSLGSAAAWLADPAAQSPG